MKKLPVHSRASRVRIACAASAMISGVRPRFGFASGITCSAAVAITVRGHSAFTRDAVVPELLRHAEHAHAHAVLRHRVRDVRREPLRLHAQRRRQIEDVRIASRLRRLLEIRQARLRADERAAHVDAEHQVEALHRRFERAATARSRWRCSRGCRCRRNARRTASRPARPRSRRGCRPASPAPCRRPPRSRAAAV